MRQYQKIIFLFYSVLVGVMVLVGQMVYTLYHEQTLRLYFFDIGQGDSILLRTPYGHAILIDGGPDNSVVYKLGKYLPWYQRKIDLVVSTHPDSDHLLGLLEVLERYEVGAVLVTNVSHDSVLHQTWWQRIQEKNIPVLIAGAVTYIPLSQQSGMEILWPESEQLDPKIIKGSNDASIVIKLSYGTSTFLLTGDAPIKPVEERLLNSRIDIDADVLKAGHHGSDTSSGAAFVKAVSPQISVISAGKDNKFGHPKPDVINRLYSAGSVILSTIEAGDIIIYSDGTKIWY